jgi:methyl-accepting chemotaxis protein
LSGKPTGFSLEWSDVTALRDSTGQLAAINKSQAVIEFQMDGTVMHANENFLKTLGYTLDEIRGKHHSLFVTPEASSAEYREFWANLNDGKYEAGEYKRLRERAGEKSGFRPPTTRSSTATASHSRLSNMPPTRQAETSNADYEGQLAAIDKAQATIEFDMNGNILKVNENFLNAVGYSKKK